jgi:hypothetical protein
VPFAVAYLIGSIRLFGGGQIASKYILNVIISSSLHKPGLKRLIDLLAKPKAERMQDIFFVFIVFWLLYSTQILD